MKKQYVKPLLRVIVLRNDAQLLQSSLHTINGGLFDYEGADVIYEGGARQFVSTQRLPSPTKEGSRYGYGVGL